MNTKANATFESGGNHVQEIAETSAVVSMRNGKKVKKAGRLVIKHKKIRMLKAFFGTDHTRVAPCLCKIQLVAPDETIKTFIVST